MADVKPEILIWARETAGLSVQEAARKLGIKTAGGQTAENRLLAVEQGNAPLPRTLLLKMTKTYHRPLIAFYMSAPPRKGDRGQDFRTVPERQTRFEPLVDALVRDIRARQAIVRSILEDEEDARPLPFIGSVRMENGIGAALASMRHTIGLDLAEFRAQASPESAFALLRAKIEAAGIFVLLIGNLGSHHTAIEAEAYRGFAMADSLAPFVIVNDQDAKVAWSFKLLHELAHLWLGSTGISGTAAEGRVEQFCNDVASNFLLPGNELSLIGVHRHSDLTTVARLVTEFANDRLLSRPMVAYRLFRAGSITENVWRTLVAQFQTEWQQSRAAQRERARQNENGPTYYVVRRHRLGTALLRFVARNMSEGMLTPTKASKVLGVKPRSVQPLLSGAALSVGEAA
jgi:Zn-dependent peptidase ImmA (M78 family)